MAKIDLAAITKGLQKVQDKATAMETVAHDELVDADLIHFAENNPYAEQDTPEELAALAEDIKVNGLIHPLVVHRESPEHYTLISGEKRYKSIRDYLKWPRIPCRVYSGLSPDRAQLMLHSANLSTREYTTEQKLRFYLDADALLRRMQESGEYTGPLQKGLAALLNVSDRQVRRYKSITEKLTPEQKAEVASGDMSMRSALELISSAKQQSEPETQQEPEQPVTPIVLPWDSTEETDSSQTEPAEEQEEPIQEEEPEENGEKPSSDNGETGERLLTDKQLHSASWKPWLEDLVHTAYNCEMLYEYYMTQVPTPQEAAEDFLRPPAFRGGTLYQQDGFYDLDRCKGVFLRKTGEPFRVRLTYIMVDTVVRGMIRRKSLLPDEKRQEILRRLILQRL